MAFCLSVCLCVAGIVSLFGLTRGSRAEGFRVPGIGGACWDAQTQVSTVHLLSDSHVSAAPRSSFFVNQSQSTNCWAGTFKSRHRWRLMKIAPLLDITSDPVSWVEQIPQAVSSGFPQRAAATFKRQNVLNLTCHNTRTCICAPLKQAFNLYYFYLNVSYPYDWNQVQ